MPDPQQIPAQIEPAASPRPSRASWKWVLRLALGALMVWLLARGARAAPLEGIRRAPPLLLAACVVAYWAGQALSARRWQLLLNALAGGSQRPSSASPGDAPGDALGVAGPVGWSECLSWYGVGMFWNLWMPTGLGGDAARALLAGRRSGDGAAGAASVLLDRVLGLASLLLLAVVALALDFWAGHAAGSTAQSSIHTARRVLLACALAGVALVTVLWVVARLTRGKQALTEIEGSASKASAGGWKRKLARLAERVASLAAGPSTWRRARVLAPAVGLSLGVQAIQIGINVALAHAVGLRLEAASMAWVVPVLALSSIVPLGIGGLGAREAGAVALLSGAFGSSDVLAWSLLWQAVVWLSSLLGAPFAWRWRHLNMPGSAREPVV